MMRPEFPNPQFYRENWQNLNGAWDFALDLENRGVEAARFDSKIEVPFCPESSLSGVGYTDFIPSCLYRREMTVTAEQLKGRVMLHFGAVDYFAHVYVNGARVGSHKGGYVPFAFEITPYLHEGKNTLLLHAQDDTRDKLIPSGKQSEARESSGCSYTRTTGIWQTVWLEYVPQSYIKGFRFITDIHNASVTVKADIVGQGTLKTDVTFDGRSVGSASVLCAGGAVLFTVPLSELHLWDIGKGNLYDVTFTLGDDVVKTYFGMREIRLNGLRFMLNGRTVFQRTVLDQGFYPDGIYTAKTAEALEKDILLSLACGFNGARLHQKVFEPLTLYYADRHGYLVWGEYPSWGLDHTDDRAYYSVYEEWTDEINRDFNHPSLIGWCPFNETWPLNGKPQSDRMIRAVYDLTKSLDPTRPCLDSSGGYHIKTDIFDVHNYEQNPETLKKQYENIRAGNVFDPCVGDRQTLLWDGKCPLFFSEYGGIQWASTEKGWGYGNAPKTPEEFMQRYKGLTDALLDNPLLCGFCYTQLTDIEQEQNGLYDYNRNPKFDVDFFKRVNSRKAAMEE